MDENFRTMEMLQGSRSEKFIESGIRRNIFTFLAQQLSEILHLTGNDGLIGNNDAERSESADLQPFRATDIRYKYR